MDINKEREAFEEAMLRMTDGSFNTTKNHLTGQYTFGVNQTFWAVWQAAKAQAVPEGYVLVPKELPEHIAEKMAIDRVDKPGHENDSVWREIAEQSYKDQVESKKWEFWRDYKAMIEAQEPTND